ncbi:A-agglutinin anchorage subunit [Fusarium oxysporum f. sp. albedinis]|nr:A-agglutinin anchorage subunit [Fusarium oxysporum f. sp. albedinis]
MRYSNLFQTERLYHSKLNWSKSLTENDLSRPQAPFRTHLDPPQARKRRMIVTWSHSGAGRDTRSSYNPG